ncbi:MAG: cytochrome c oxidase subunit II [Gemmatimonadota bacterium]|nr:cytochrome c oxidase subunit II [Gemmatimonadota bacterium]
MTSLRRPRQRLARALAAVSSLALAACDQITPNSTLTPHSEFGRAIDGLWRETLVLGTIVFVLVELALIFVIFRFRRRDPETQPKHVHGNTTLEITWTLIPAVILGFIAVPTVRTIFETQAKAVSSALQVEVIGHQWWWEFRYPQYGVVTANELYLPVGRTASFALKTQDVLHSFWIPELAGKRDLITNRTNYLWFTPESSYVWNGFCAEYCGDSHGYMHFRVFTVPPARFDEWIAHQKAPPAFGAQGEAATAMQRPVLPLHAVPSTPTPAGLAVANVSGDPARGADLYKRSMCIACHAVQGVSAGNIGPNLTHVGSRTTIAGSIYPNDAHHLMLWIKNAPLMKPGSIMPALGAGQFDRKTGMTVAAGGLTDQQIADITAYLLALK